MPYQEEQLTIRGTSIQMLKGGSGDPLLYLHSAGGEMVWLPFFEQLSQHYSVYLPAHPGFSQSEGLEKIDSVEDLVFHYTDLMDELGLSQAYVVGLSLGGWLAAEFATRYSNRIRKLALINAVGLHIPGAPFADIFAASPTQTRSLIFSDPDSTLAKSFIPDDATPEMVSDVLKARAATARIGWNPYLCNRKLRERLYRVSVPTLIVWGASDRLVPYVHAQAYQAGIAGAQFVLIKDCGHAPPFEKPQETVGALVDFFKT